MVYESRDHGNDVTCHTVPVALFLFFVKIILFLNMDKEEPNFSIWGEISDSALVLEATIVEEKCEKQQGKRRFARDFPRNFKGN